MRLQARHCLIATPRRVNMRRGRPRKNKGKSVRRLPAREPSGVAAYQPGIEPWRTAVPDWKDRLLTGQSLVPTLPLNEAEADNAEWIFKHLRLPDVRDTPEIGEVGRPWIYEIVRALFGSYDPIVDRRSIQELFLLVPKKNGKSTFAAAMMLTAILI